MFKLMESSVDNWRHELPSIWSHGFSFSSFAVEEDSSLGGSQLACYDGEEPVINIVDPDQIFNLQQMDPPPSSDHTNHNGSGSSYGAANHHHLLIDGLNDALLFMEEDHHAAAGAGGGGVSSKFDQVGVGGSIDHCFNNNEEDRGVISVTTSSSMIIDQVSYSNKILTGSGGSNIICSSSPPPLSVFTSSEESVVTDHHMDNNLIKEVVLSQGPTTATTSNIFMTKKRKRILDTEQDDMMMIISDHHHDSRKLGVVGDLFNPQVRFNSLHQQLSQSSECTTSSAVHDHQTQLHRGGTFSLICKNTDNHNRSSSSLINPPRLHPPPPSRAVKGRPSKKKTKQLENSTTHDPIYISSSSTSNISFQRDPINNIKSTDGGGSVETIFGWTDNNHNNHDSSEPDAEAIQQMKEMIYRAAVFRPINLGEDEVGGGGVLLTAEKRRRKNVRISTDPQTVAARQRRERISDRLRVLQKLVPGGSKMDTASMLDEAANYLKFLRSQIKALESMGSITGDDISNTTSWCNYPMMGSVIPGHVKYLQFSPSVLTMPMPSLVYSGGGGFSNPMQNQQHKSSSCGPVH